MINYNSIVLKQMEQRFPAKFSDRHSSWLKAILSGMKGAESRKDHITPQEVSPFAFVANRLSKWELFDVWIEIWMCIKMH